DPHPGPWRVVADQRRARRTAARAARLRARANLARRRRLATRRPVRDADTDADRDRRTTLKDAVLHEPVRVDDRDRPPHPAQRQALAGRRHAQALDRRWHAPSRAAVPTDHRLPTPRQARDSDRTSHPHCQQEPRPPGDRRARYRVTVNRGTPSKFHDDPDILIGFAACVEALARYGSQNPLVAHAIREPHFPALKVSDFVSRREFRRTDVYDCLFRPSGLEYPMACGLPGPQALVVGISINRCSREFSERDRALLDLLRPHLVQAHARAAARELSQATILMLEAALGGVGRAAILLSAGGVIQAASAQALQWLDEYCPAPPSEEMLPEPLAAWQERRREILTKGGARSGDEVLEIRSGSRCLTIRAIGEQEADHDLLVFEERHEVSWHQLRMLGLTPRQ